MHSFRAAFLLTHSLASITLVVACGGDDPATGSDTTGPATVTGSSSGSSTSTATETGGSTSAGSTTTADVATSNASTATTTVTTTAATTAAVATTAAITTTTDGVAASSSSGGASSSGSSAEATTTMATGDATGAGGTGTGAGGTGAQTTDTWTNFAQEFFATYCVSCHNEDGAGDASRDQTQLSVVVAESDAIACGVATAEIRALLDCGAGDPAANQFPAGNGPSPTDEERARLVDWLEAGAPE